MLIEFNDVGDSASVGGATASVPAEDVRAFSALMAVDSTGGGSPLATQVSQYADSLSAKFSDWRNDWASFGGSLNLNDHASAVKALHLQASLTSKSVEFQFALQTADSVRHAFGTLYRQQA